MMTETRKREHNILVEDNNKVRVKRSRVSVKIDYDPSLANATKK